MIAMTLREQKEWLAKELEARRVLQYLMDHSEAIRLVTQSKNKPEDIDSALFKLRKRVAELERQHENDLKQIEYQRNLIDVLKGA